MHLIVNAQPLQTSSARRGIGRYTKHLVQALRLVRPDWRIEAALNAALPAPGRKGLPAGVPTIAFTPPLPMVAATRGANELYLGDWLTSQDPDVMLESSPFEEEGLVPRFVPPRPRLAAIAYDVIPVLFPDHYLRRPVAHATYRQRFRQALQADLLLAISETTRRDVMHVMRCDADRVVTIGGAAEWTDAPLASDAAAAPVRFDIDKPFLLYVGGPDPRKNLWGTLAAFAALPAALREAHQLVIVGALTPEQQMALEREGEALGIRHALRLTGYVDDGDLRALYATCRLSIFPSFYEGLGLPMLEALLAGAPVVASNRGAIPEYSGDVTRLADPASPGGIAAALVEELSVPREAGEERRRAFGASFTWTAAAERAATALERLAGRAPSSSPARLRVAWVSALPPSRSPAAQLSQRLLPRLRERFDMTLVVDAGATVARDVAGPLEVLRPKDLWSRHVEAPFDLFVYHLDESNESRRLAGLARWQSGLAVVHGERISTSGPEWTAIAAGDGVIVHSASVWRRLREERTLRTFVVREPDGDALASAYAQAMQLTAALREGRDGAWCDAAAGAVIDAGLTVQTAHTVIQDWAALRTSSRRQDSAAR